MRDEQRKALKLEHKNLSDIKFSNCRRWRQKSSSSASPRLNENSNNNANDMKREKNNNKNRNGRMSDPMDVGAFSGVLNVCVFCCSAGWLTVCPYARPPIWPFVCLWTLLLSLLYSQRKNFQLLMIFHRWPNIEFFLRVCVFFFFFRVFCLFFGWGWLLLLWLLLLGIQFGWLKIN